VNKLHHGALVAQVLVAVETLRELNYIARLLLMA
jgi:hypothetical protein